MVYSKETWKRWLKMLIIDTNLLTTVQGLVAKYLYIKCSNVVCKFHEPAPNA